MNLKLILVVVLYVFIALIMCAFILANEDAESLGNPSPISVVRSTQKGSIIEYIIWSFATLFLISCIILNRLRNAQSLSRVLNQTLSAQSNSKVQQNNPSKETTAAIQNYTESDDTEDIDNLSNQTGRQEYVLDDEVLDDLDTVLRVNE